MTNYNHLYDNGGLLIFFPPPFPVWKPGMMRNPPTNPPWPGQSDLYIYIYMVLK